VMERLAAEATGAPTRVAPKEHLPCVCSLHGPERADGSVGHWTPLHIVGIPVRHWASFAKPKTAPGLRALRTTAGGSTFAADGGAADSVIGR
jgi:hypothetical protein